MSQTEGTIIACSACSKKNRVRPTAKGVPQCASCHQPLPWLVSADERTFPAEVTASVPVLVDFWASWCGPCRMIAPVLEELVGSLAGRLKVIKVNVDENPQLAARYQAMSIPLLVLFRDGDEISRQVGALPAAQLTAWLQTQLS